MSATINTTARDLFVELKAFIVAQLGIDAGNVIQGYNNRAAMPTGGFVVMSMVYSNRLATNTHSNTDDSLTVLKPTDVAVQIDCYGDKSYEWSHTLCTLLRDDVSISDFPSGIVPLYADDARLMPIINSEQQYEKRWMFTANFQVNSAVTLGIQTANTLGELTLYPVI